MKAGSWETRQDGDQRVCATCGTVACGYRYRLHPDESPFFERCIGLAWCSKCRVYTAAMVHVPRGEVLADALAELPVAQQEQLRSSERRLIDYLYERAPGE